MSPWRNVVAAMVKSGGGSIASGLLSAVGTKIIAATLGPAGTALVSTLQQTRDVAVSAATANGRTALVQGLSTSDPLQRREYLRTSLSIFSTGILATAIVLSCARERVAVWAGLGSQDSYLLAGLTVAVALTSAFVFLSALANVLGEIGKLAWAQVVLSAVAAVTAWPVAQLVIGGSRGALDAWLAITAGAGVAAALWMIASHRTTLRAWTQCPGRWWSWPAARHFFSISGAMLATSLLGSLVMLGLRARIIHAEGLDGAGWFDAAWTISMRHVTLVLASLQTYYLPALASARDSDERAGLIGRVLMAATLVMAPVVIALEVARPWITTLLYADSFQPATKLLRWTLAGDYLKVTSWVLAMPMLAVADMKAFLSTELIVQAVFAGSAITLGAMLKPSEGTAMAFVLSYLVNLVACFCYAGQRHAFRPSRTLTVVWGTGLMLVILSATR